MEDSPKKMLRSAMSFFSGTMLSRLSGLFRDIAMAFAFGTEASLAAFFVAFRFAHLFRRLLGEGALQTVFVPHFESLRKQKEGAEGALKFYLDLYVFLTLVLLCVISIGMIICGAILKGYLGVWNVLSNEIVYLCLLMLPSLLFICLASLNASLLQCEQSYFLPSASPIAFNLIWIIGVLLLQKQAPAEAMPSLALCIVGACLFQWAVMLFKVLSVLRRLAPSLTFWSYFKTIHPFSEDVKRLWKPFLLGIVGVGAAQINSALDAVFASFAESSGPAYLWYAIRLQQLPLALFGIALSGALLPPLTRSIVAGDVSKSDLLLSEAIKRSLFLILPVTALIFLVGRLSIDFLYGYGDFSARSIDGTKNCLFGYGLGLIPMTLVLVLAPLFYARQHYRIPSICSVAAVVINIGLNALFVLVFGWGAFSIALGTSFSAWVNMGLLVAFMDKPMQKVVWASIRQSLKSIGGALILASLATYFASDWFVLTGSFAIKGLRLLSLVLTFSASLLVGYYFFSALQQFYNSKKIPFTS